MHQLARPARPPRRPASPPAAAVASSAARPSSAHRATGDRAVAVSSDDLLAERALEVAYRTALGITHDPQLASDVAQEVAIKALRHVGRLRDPQALGAWLHRTTVRTAIDEHRRSGRRRAAEDGFGAEVPVAHLDDDGAGHRDALEMLRPLPDRQRAAMTLRHVHDLTDRQIAQALGCRTGTARSLLSRATATLRDQLTPTPSTKDPR